MSNDTPTLVVTAPDATAVVDEGTPPGGETDVLMNEEKTALSLSLLSPDEHNVPLAVMTATTTGRSTIWTVDSESASEQAKNIMPVSVHSADAHRDDESSEAALTAPSSPVCLLNIGPCEEIEAQLEQHLSIMSLSNSDAEQMTLQEDRDEHLAESHLDGSDSERASEELVLPSSSPELPHGFSSTQSSAGIQNRPDGSTKETRSQLQLEDLVLLGRHHVSHYEQSAQEEVGVHQAIAQAEHGDRLFEQAARTGNTTPLDEAIPAYRYAVSHLPESHPRMVPVLGSLAGALQMRFECFGDISDLEEVIPLTTRCVALIPDGNPHKPTFLFLLGSVHQARFDRLGEIGDLEQAILHMTRSVNLTLDGHPDMPCHLGSLGSVLNARFEFVGEMDDLEQALALMSRSDNLTPDVHPSKPHSLGNLGTVLLTRYRRLGEVGDLERAISLLTRSVDLTSEEDSQKPIWLSNLGFCFEVRFRDSGERSDLETAISLSSLSVRLMHDGHPNMPYQLSNLGNALQARFECLGKIDDLETAISTMACSVDLTPDGHINKPRWLHDFGAAVLLRFEHFGKMEDLEMAISLNARAVDLTLDDHTDKPSRLSRYGHTLLERFELLGDIGDLEEAISLTVRAVDLTPDGHPAEPTWLNNLGRALMMRFERLGETGDLEGAVSATTRSVNLTPDGHPDKPTRFSNLGIAFKKRYERLSEVGDLESAISLMTRSVDLTPDEHPSKPHKLNNTGTAFRMRFERLSEISDLEKAISLMTRSVDLSPDERPEKPDLLYNLGNAFEMRFRWTGEISDLELAIMSRRRAIGVMPNSHTDLSGYLATLARDIQTHFNSTGHPGVCPEAVKHLETATTSEVSPPQHRLQAVRGLVHLYWHSQTQAHDSTLPYDKLISAYTRAFTLIPEAIWLGSSIDRRYELLKDIGDITSGAAAAAIATGDLTTAVEWIEQGRGIVWSQLLQLRNPLDALHKCYPELAQQLQAISRQLEISADVAAGVTQGKARIFSGNSSRSNIGVRDKTTQRIQLARDYQIVLSKIRRLEGFESFLMPKKLASVAHAFNSGPVIFINVHKLRSDALVCLATDRIIHVPLLEFPIRIAQAMLSEFILAVLGPDNRKRTVSRVSASHSSFLQDELIQRGVVTEEYSSMEDVLGILWSHVVLPILQAIQGELYDNIVDTLPHVTWCATGPLALLPIHAAGEYGRASGRKVFDFVVSSYTPSLSSLAKPPAHSPHEQSHPSKILIISQPATPGYSELPGVAIEAAKLKGHFLEEDVVHLHDKEATVSAVLHAMCEYQHPYIHLACHGTQDTTNPRDSSFALYDGKLSLAQLMSKSANNATLAFLSACQTATGDTELTEESIHLAAGLLAVGYRGVIGTLWSIADEDAPLVADVFYRVLHEKQAKAAEGAVGGSQAHAAYALHSAMNELRESIGESKILRWAPFVHLGL